MQRVLRIVLHTTPAYFGGNLEVIFSYLLCGLLIFYSPISFFQLVSAFCFVSTNKVEMSSALILVLTTQLFQLLIVVI